MLITGLYNCTSLLPAEIDAPAPEVLQERCRPYIGAYSYTGDYLPYIGAYSYTGDYLPYIGAYSYTGGYLPYIGAYSYIQELTYLI